MKLQEVTDKIQVYEKSISEKTTEINAMEREIRNIEQEIDKLRNK